MQFMQFRDEVEDQSGTLLAGNIVQIRVRNLHHLGRDSQVLLITHLVQTMIDTMKHSL